MLCPPRWLCLPICLPSGFVFHLGWGAVSASLGLSPNLSPIWLCLPVLSPHLFSIWLCLSPWLGCCVRLAGLVSRVAMRFFPQTVYCWGSQCFLSVSALTGMLCPLRWACLRSCLPPCLPSGLGCCVRLAGLSPVLSPSLSPIWSEMLCPPPWSCLSLVSGLVSQLLSLFCLVACLSSWACLFLVSGLVSQLVSHLVWDAVFAFLARLPAQLVSGLLSHPVFQLVWCVRALGLSPKFHVRFVQLFGVYGGVILELKAVVFTRLLCKLCRLIYPRSVFPQSMKNGNLAMSFFADWRKGFRKLSHKLVQSCKERPLNI